MESGYIGNVLKIVPGQESRFFEKPKYQVMANFSPFKMDAEYRPWMGLDRYETAKSMLGDAEDDFDEEDCSKILRAVSQQVCPTVVSMVFEVTDMVVYWCENRQWDKIQKRYL